MSILRIIMTHWGSGDPNDRLALRHYYVNHYEHVRQVVPKEKLLEFQSSDGWGPLCQFLGKEARNVEYPRVNDAAQTVNLHIFLQFFRVWKLVEKPLIYLGALGAALWAVWLGYRKIDLE